MCRIHYGNQYRNGTLEDRPKMPTGGACPTDRCEGTIAARGLCENCRWAQRQGKDPALRRGLNPPKPLEERYVVTDSECWEWTGTRTNGYGEAFYNGKKGAAHRLAYEKWVGPIPEGLLIRHKCDNPPCINPDHLEPGTIKQNAEDMVRRGRSGVGEAGSRAKLTETQVHQIRDEYEYGVMGYRRLAEKYGVTQTTIKYIVIRKTWTHI